MWLCLAAAAGSSAGASSSVAGAAQGGREEVHTSPPLPALPAAALPHAHMAAADVQVRATNTCETTCALGAR